MGFRILKQGECANVNSQLRTQICKVTGQSFLAVYSFVLAPPSEVGVSEAISVLASPAEVGVRRLLLPCPTETLGWTRSNCCLGLRVWGPLTHGRSVSGLVVLKLLLKVLVQMFV